MGELSFRDKASAEWKAFRSRLYVTVPALAQLATGDPIRVTPLGYHVASVMANQVSNWAEFPGNPQAGKRSKTHRQIGVVTVGESFGKEWENNPEAQPAILRTVGEAVLVGVLPRHVSEDMRYPFTYGMRIGPDTLRTAPALMYPDKTMWVPSDGTFAAEEPVLSFEEVVSAVPERARIY